jgi:hypothetical protein
MEYILLGVSLVVSIGIIIYLFVSLTPHVIPANLVGFFFGILWVALGFSVVVHIVLFLVQFFLG